MVRENYRPTPPKHKKLGAPSGVLSWATACYAVCLARAMAATSGIIVLTSVIDVQRLPEILRPMVDDLREATITGLSLARDLIPARSNGLAKFLSHYVDVIDSTEDVLNSVNQRLAYRFGRMAECKMTK